MKPVVFILAMSCLHAAAAPVAFVERAPYASGAAVIEPAAGGEYVYGAPVLDGRLRTQAVLVGAPQRQAYVFFSAEEEAALLAYRDQALAEQLKRRVASARKRHYNATASLDWPKVVVRADEICVPELASSSAADWRDHLVCHRDGGLR
jgi:hypothetical protein